jgi:uncharacterized protein
MPHTALINKTVAYVKQELANAEGGHDWFHIERVWNNAKLILQTESANALVVELGALLHDIADSKFHGGDETIGPAKAAAFLRENECDEEVIAHVVNIINHISFKGGNQAQTFKSAELDVVQDADRLDAIGAIGIARAFNFGGFKNRPLHNPAIPPKLDMDKEEYKQRLSPTLNHFWEKLFLLKDRMNTTTGKRLAEERDAFMHQFVNQFLDEWNGRS